MFYLANADFISYKAVYTKSLTSYSKNPPLKCPCYLLIKMLMPV